MGVNSATTSAPAPQGVIDVAVAVVVRPAAGPGRPTVLITRRPRHTVYGGFWEFPGGKLEPGESPSAGVVRELWEELGIAVEPGAMLTEVEHVYPHGHVRLRALLCTCAADAVPQNLGVAEHRWAPVDELPDYRFPEANEPILRRIQDLHANPAGLTGI